MKHLQAKCYVLHLVLFFSAVPLFGQNKELNYEMSSSVGFSSDTTLPFWLLSNRYGTVPDSDHILLNTSVYSDFNKPANFFDFSYKASVTGYLAEENKLLVNELYIRLRLQDFFVDIGAKNDAVVWDGLSSSNGNIVKSINARAMPGFNLKTNDYLTLPFAKKWLRIKGNFAHYFMNDTRAVDGAYLHHKSLFIKSKLSPKFEVIAGLDHYAQWGGTSEEFGKQPSSFSDYLKIIVGAAGGETATGGDQNNALGNHLGAYLLQVSYYEDKVNLNFYYSHPFEDRSGREMKNWMDGLYGLFVDFKKDKAIVTQLLGEFTYTKHMSGSRHLEPSDDGNFGRGKDDYFNNSLYTSGWTYFGKTIGSPYFTTSPVDENGITHGVIQGDNRFMAFNIGAKGIIKSIPYKAMLSHTTYYGWFENEYDPYPVQISGLLELILPQSILNLPFEISTSMSFDTGTYRPVNFGAFLSLRKTGIF